MMQINYKPAKTDAEVAGSIKARAAYAFSYDSLSYNEHDERISFSSKRGILCKAR